MLEIVTLLIQHPLGSLYLLQSLAYAITAMISHQTQHGTLAVCYGSSAIFQALIATYYLTHLP